MLAASCGLWLLAMLRDEHLDEQAFDAHDCVPVALPWFVHPVVRERVNFPSAVCLPLLRFGLLVFGGEFEDIGAPVR
jgi:hypothetical protein